MLKNSEGLPLFRLIIPAHPEVNIFTYIARKTTALGPVMVATAADKVEGIRVEIIDENNCRGAERDGDGLLDHRKLQEKRPASVVGFYCGLSSTMLRVWDLAKFYNSQGVFTIAGGWHTHYLPEESLRQSIDVVVHGDGEEVIKKILSALIETDFSKDSISDIPGISLLENDRLKTNPAVRITNLNRLPYPNFGLLRNAKIKIYPVGRIRGCSKRCEFCSVKNDSPRWASAQNLFETIGYLKESRGAKQLFITDDNTGEKKDREETIKAFRKIAEEYGSSLWTIVQIGLESAKDTELLDAMKKAGVREVCIGYESPIDEELKAMRKGYSSSDMLEWTRIFHRFGFLIHGMFIFAYPADLGVHIPLKERIGRYKKFIASADLDTIQVLIATPLAGTALRERLEKEDRLLSLDVVPWSYYDGNHVCYVPSDMTMEELQQSVMKIMKHFYHARSFWRIGVRTILMPLDFMVRGWHAWYRGWRNDIKKFGGYILISQWFKNHEQKESCFEVFSRIF
jgi:radical SAM superfamily enzyme YgiQ (UPF0313 family)